MTHLGQKQRLGIGHVGLGDMANPITKILTQKVKVKDLFSEGNDLNEFGYFPQE